MSEVDRSYELKVLKMAINSYLDEIVPVTEKDLNSLEGNRDRVVWQLATKIYSQSGHKVEFCIIRDVVNCRIETMKAQLEATRRVAEKKACQAAQKARQAAAEEEERLRKQMTRIYRELGGDEDKARVFVRVQKIISEQLSVDASKVNLDSHLSNDLGADELDLVELVSVLEEEFEIEIPDSLIDFPDITASFKE